MENCWHREPDRRPTFEALHEDFSNFENTCNDKYAYVTHYGERQTASGSGSASAASAGRDKNRRGGAKAQANNIRPQNAAPTGNRPRRQKKKQASS